MMLFAGLGNPGATYDDTRHNVGFSLVDAFATKHEFPDWQENSKVHGLVTRMSLSGTPVILLKPTTFMNLSGRAVQAALSYYKVDQKNLLVIHDEMAFPFGTLRFATSGSAGGHNGVASVIEALSSQDFVRLRIGIQPPPGTRFTLETYVLAHFAKEEAPRVHDVLARGVTALDSLRTRGIAEATLQLHTEKSTQSSSHATPAS